MKNSIVKLTIEEKQNVCGGWGMCTCDDVNIGKQFNTPIANDLLCEAMCCGLSIFNAYKYNGRGNSGNPYQSCIGLALRFFQF